MGRFKIITYGIHRDNGHVWSRVGNEYAVPVLEFENMKPENNWTMNHHLEKFQGKDVYHDYPYLIWTKKIPLQIKNQHRIFWGMSPLKSGPEFSYEFTKNGRLKITDQNKGRVTYL